MEDIWELLKTKNGMVLAFFIAGIFSMNSKDLQNIPCTIICILICAMIFAMIILIICPDDLRPYIASALIALSIISLIYRTLIDESCPDKGYYQMVIESPNYKYTIPSNQTSSNISDSINRSSKTE